METLQLKQFDELQLIFQMVASKANTVSLD